MEYQWYPGHMTKARRQMEENIRLVDIVIELLDARIPLSSRNPDIDKLAGTKARLLILSKSDLADESITRAWVDYFGEQGLHAIPMDARARGGMKFVTTTIMDCCKAKLERDRARGIRQRPIRAMVCGIPNAGKSTFINSFSGRSSTKTGDTPGVTRGVQWIRLNKQVELLDTPGVLWPKFEDPNTGLRIALIGSIKDDILDEGELSLSLIGFLNKEYPGALADRYGCDNLEDIARVRGCLKKGGEADFSRCASLILEDFRSGRLGRISLERP